MDQAKVILRRDWTLEILLLLYLGASLLHFVHNAEYVQDYPNLPGWIDRSSVYLTWLGLTAGGLPGYVLYQHTLAPMGEHTQGMNFTIWFEVLVATLLLLYLMVTARKRLSQ